MFSARWWEQSPQRCSMGVDIGMDMGMDVGRWHADGGARWQESQLAVASGDSE